MTRLLFFIVLIAALALTAMAMVGITTPEYRYEPKKISTTVCLPPGGYTDHCLMANWTEK